MSVPPTTRPAGESSGGPLFLRLVLFFGLSCLFSWWPYAATVALGSDTEVFNFPLGPLFAAVLVIGLTEGKAGLRDWWRRMTRFRGPVRFYAAAILIPTAIPLVAAALAIFAGVDAPEGSLWLEGVLPAVAFIVPMALIGGPIGEELGFRGWGQYRLQERVSPFVAALIIGAGVIVWHLPLLLGGNIPWTAVIALPAVSVVYAWVYRMSGTIWTAVAVHTFHNIVSGEYIGTAFDGEAAGLRVGILAVIYVAWAAYIVVRYGTSLDGKGGARPAQAASTAYDAAPTGAA